MKRLPATIESALQDVWDYVKRDVFLMSGTNTLTREEVIGYVRNYMQVPATSDIFESYNKLSSDQKTDLLLKAFPHKEYTN